MVKQELRTSRANLEKRLLIEREAHQQSKWELARRANARIREYADKYEAIRIAFEDIKRKHVRDGKKTNGRRRRILQ